MIRPVADPGAFKSGPGPADNPDLRKAADGLEAVLFGELLKAMRETVPREGVLEGGAAESVFTGMLDVHLSAIAASRQQGGLSDALYRQLERLIRTTAQIDEATK